jgi:hypothetical protein
MYTLSPVSFITRHMFSCTTHRIHVSTPLCILSCPPPPPPLSQSYGSTALILAAQHGKPRSVDVLIKADPSGDHLNMKVG